MHKDKFYQCGKLIYTFRWAIVILFFLGVALCTPLLPKVITQFKAIGFLDPYSESAKADEFLKNRLSYYHNRFIVMYHSKKSLNNPKSLQEIRNSLASLKDFPLRYEILYPDDNPDQISKDKKTAYAVIAIRQNEELSADQIADLKSSIKKTSNFTISIGGEPVFMDDANQQTQQDLIQAEYIATPVAVITLLLVFGSVAAALVPMLLDGICAILILSILYAVSFRFSLSVFTLNIALLLGLCLSLDYALFIISRFREELAAGNNVREALAITHATAGKAVFFSGLAVMISLSALLIFPINVLFSVGVGGLTAVAVAVLVSVVLLPALLAILNKRINWLSLYSQKQKSDSKIWSWLVHQVIRRPWPYFFSILAVLLILGYPFLSVEFGLSDFRILPKTAASRDVFDAFQTQFNKNQLTPIIVTMKTRDDTMLTKSNIAYLYQFVDQLQDDPRVERVDSIVTTDPRLSKQQYQQLYTQKKSRLPTDLQRLLKLTTDDNFTVLNVLSKYPVNSEETKAMVEKIRDKKLPRSFNVTVTGTSAATIDVFDRIKQLFPYAFIWIISLTFLILLVLLRSLVLPIKAIIMNMLSLFASYGVLVFIIQQGHLSSLLNFEPQEIVDISLIIIIFCALFGFSMDYEVFLLSRIKEEYERTGNTNKSIAYGIIHSSRIITSAAIIVILICFAFLSADILLVKAFGLGIAVAIFVDAFLIRTILVPATIAILQKWTWYLPKWMDKLLPKLTFNIKEH
jgi:putative drug exporter of the RND superfamily